MKLQDVINDAVLAKYGDRVHTNSSICVINHKLNATSNFTAIIHEDNQIMVELYNNNMCRVLPTEFIYYSDPNLMRKLHKIIKSHMSINHATINNI